MLARECWPTGPRRSPIAEDQKAHTRRFHAHGDAAANLEAEPIDAAFGKAVLTIVFSKSGGGRPPKSRSGRSDGPDGAPRRVLANSSMRSSASLPGCAGLAPVVTPRAARCGIT